MIAQVKEKFHGRLTYCSIMWPVETNNIQFWDSLDFIAMDTYVPFWNGTGDVPTQQDMNMVCRREGGEGCTYKKNQERGGEGKGKGEGKEMRGG